MTQTVTEQDVQVAIPQEHTSERIKEQTVDTPFPEAVEGDCAKPPPGGGAQANIWRALAAVDAAPATVKDYVASSPAPVIEYVPSSPAVACAGPDSVIKKRGSISRREAQRKMQALLHEADVKAAKQGAKLCSLLPDPSPGALQVELPGEPSRDTRPAATANWPATNPDVWD